VACCHEIALQTVKEFVRRGKPFTYFELSQEILKRGGCLRVAPNYSILEYLQRLEYHGFVECVGSHFVPTKKGGMLR